MKRQHPEDAIQRACVQFLELRKPPCLWFHPPNGGARSKVEAAIFQGLGVKAGVPDFIFLWYCGRGVVEVKTPTGRLSPAQKNFRDACHEMEIPWALIRGVDELAGVLLEWGLL